MSGLGYEQFPKEIFSLHPKDPIFSLELSLSTLAIARVLELIKFNSSPLKMWWLRTTYNITLIIMLVIHVTFCGFYTQFWCPPMTAPVRYWWEFRIWKMIHLDSWANFIICLLKTTNSFMSFCTIFL